MAVSQRHLSRASQVPGECSRTGSLESLGQPGTGELALQAQLLASDTPHPHPQVRWMMYWIVFALFMAVETFTDIFISWYACRGSVGCGEMMAHSWPSSLADLTPAVL